MEARVIRSYRISRIATFIMIIMLIALSFSDTYLVFFSIAEYKDMSFSDITFTIIWLAGTGLAIYFLLNMPFEIVFQKDGAIIFRSLIDRMPISPKDIKSIKSTPFPGGYIVIECIGGDIYMLNRIINTEDFLAEMKAANPSVETDVSYPLLYS